MKCKSKIMADEKYIEVRTVWSDKEANDLFLDGWQLIHGGMTHIDSQGLNAKVCFVMGKLEIKHDKKA